MLRRRTPFSPSSGGRWRGQRAWDWGDAAARGAELWPGPFCPGGAAGGAAGAAGSWLCSEPRGAR